jgi:hypothetical protein
LPYIGAHSRYPGHLFALGYGGNGMTASFLAARMLLDLYQARDKGRQAVSSPRQFVCVSARAKVTLRHNFHYFGVSGLRLRPGEGGRMKRSRNFYVGVSIAVVVAVLAVAQYALQTVASAQGNGGTQAGIYEVDRMWPKPLPNNWVLGSTVGLAVDARDHVFVVHRGQATLDPKFASQMVFAPTGRGARGGAPGPW